ncbi:acyl-CoA dehydrogenase family protein [Stackebrandtia nassauensis]|uniref:Acyl-CoA dehydrogenase domain protein n=1 Tax=Stackebrandtia nassauensis (strain DSM 44728 / CIP 108903 / NRRL B-16338 / NBRC 102104 / LLR-40K-21) TaxID=446470 RepID=D3PX56_STANL|nr:acyl-CoA dehydrogenase family protein [Stackebrandtia nassauensis]ADD45280.1 acyl-CoA dehydrogenase domain protein [Stackebrandtia nassauensis DSM 44728]
MFEAEPVFAAANQVPPLEDRNLFHDNVPLVEAAKWAGAEWVGEAAWALGEVLGSGDAARWAEQANVNRPVLRTHDRYGNRVDEVDFHPAWHRFMALSVEFGCHAMPWRDPRDGAHAARAVLFSMLGQIEPGHGCPISMTYASVPVLRANPELAAQWEPSITSTSYDPGLRPRQAKEGVLVGMAMTEKQGGSDVRANVTRATRLDDGTYALRGHKWFCSAPMNDAFLVLAQAEGGLSCFLLPRVLPDGSRNAIRIQRLKDKLGNHANASSEIELHDAIAFPVGEEGRGVRTIIEMVNHTRLDCVIGTAAGMRQCVAEATWHAAHRSAFGKPLIEQPLMRQVLADLCVESEAATATMMRLAAAYDRPEEAAFRRLATAVAKYWVCKRGPGHAAEALECLGGNGYVEEAPLARRYREQPLMSIWEGSGNVVCLDILRAMRTDPETIEAFLNEVGLASGADRAFDAHVAGLKRRLAAGPDEASARLLADDLALALQGSLLLRHAPSEVAGAFTAARLGDNRGASYGAVPAGLAATGLVERNLPGGQ